MEPTSKPMSIQGPFHNERQRLTGAFTDEDRKWRKQWLKDQELSHNEPRPIPEYKNPIRRAYRFPLDFVFSKLESTLGKNTEFVRYWTGKYLIAGFGVLAVHYYFKYNAHDWTRKKGWYTYSTRDAVYPGDPRFPMVSDKTKPSDYADHGFKKATI